MSPVHHAIVWIDHREAKVYRFSERDEPPVQVNAHNSLQRLHHRHGGWEAGRLAAIRCRMVSSSGVSPERSTKPGRSS